MIKSTLALTILPIALTTQATCITDPPEMGDIGPSSELVCVGLERQFPGATLAVVDRSIQSPTQVAIRASVNGRPNAQHYELTGYSWRLDPRGARIADVPTSAVDVPIDQ